MRNPMPTLQADKTSYMFIECTVFSELCIVIPSVRWLTHANQL